MKCFNWLHLTDLHFGLQGQHSLWPNLRKVFFDDLAHLHERCGPWHAVLFTGDMTQTGKKEEFAAFDEKVLGPLFVKLRELGSIDTALLTVPGNHDIERPDSKKPTAALRLLLKKEGYSEVETEFWNDTACEYRKLVDAAFANYSSWSKKKNYREKAQYVEGAFPGDFAATLKLNGVGANQLRIGIVGLNTTFLQLSAGDFSKRLALNPEQLHSICGEDSPKWVESHDATILMTHQGLDWLDPNSSNHVYPEINPAGRFATHLFGHMHETVIRSTSMGGGLPLRQWQGSSLFGMEKYGDPPTNARRHGYSAGRIDFTEEIATIRQWPRRAVKSVNGWKFDRDSESCELIDLDGGTKPEQIVKPGGKTGSLSQSITTGSILKQEARNEQCSPTALTWSIEVPSGWKWPHDEPALKSYCEAICKTHSQIKFVEIPYLKDVSDVGMDNLFVEPCFSAQEIHPDVPPESWPKCELALDTLNKYHNLVLLGDPGSGKSTLVSCLAWQLCRPKSAKDNAWAKYLGGCVPLPIILRELNLKADLTWESLLESFLEHRLGKLLPNRRAVESMLKEGRTIILLDGLDEIGNLTIRKKLRDATHAGMAAYPKSRWILTSRMVGYDLVPFHFKIEKSIPKNVSPRSKIRSSVRTVMADLLYLAPFNDEQIESFSINWYAQHEKEQEIIQNSAKDFVQAIRENEGTQRLARIPYLLTLMALIYHKNASLPHGRTELYERIATAYLESIDLRRQLNQLPYSLAQKKRWLAEVAFRMQLRRTKRSDQSRQGEILASKAEIQKWLRRAMRESGVSDTKSESDILLNYFAQRSGLLLPRGEGKFAFMHLSLQEYFAACFLEPRLTASRFSPVEHKIEPSNEQLHSWANHPVWRESFVLLFELLSEKSSSETEAFLDHLFENRLWNDVAGHEATAVGLLAELATDPFVLLPAETRCKLRQQSWRWVFGLGKSDDIDHLFEMPSDKVVRTLLRESQCDLQRAWKAASISRQELRKVAVLDLSANINLVDLSPLVQLKSLKSLNLNDCTSLSDISVLANLKSLRSLVLENCPNVLNFTPISALLDLERLVLGSPIDLNLLSELKSLQDVHLHYSDSKLIDVTPLAGLPELNILCCSDDAVEISKELLASPEKISSVAVQRIAAIKIRQGRKRVKRR